MSCIIQEGHPERDSEMAVIIKARLVVDGSLSTQDSLVRGGDCL